MPYTDQSDVYSAVHEDGINSVIDHLRRKRPSLFNYATPAVIQRAESRRDVEMPLASMPESALCSAVDAAPEVREWNNALMEDVDPLPVLGTDGIVKLDYCLQIADLSIDFSPDDPPVDVGEQQFALSVLACGGLGCPYDESMDAIRRRVMELRAEHGDKIDSLDSFSEEKRTAIKRELGIPIIPEWDELECFCLRVTVVGSVTADGPPAEGPPSEGGGENQDDGSWLTLKNTPELSVDDLIFASRSGEERFSMPSGLTNSLTCYLRSFIEFSLIPALNSALTEITPSIPAKNFFSIQFQKIEPVVSLPTGSGIGPNPALEDDQLKVYADVALTNPGGS